jgi:hypothetical protein
MFALYLYCLARPDTPAKLDGPGVDSERPLDLIPFKDVMAVVSEVRVGDFLGPSAEAQMKDLAWVGPRACRHEEVIERAMRFSPVVPARFATLFSSRESLATWLKSHHDAISRALDRFADHEEWAVKGTLDRRKAEARFLAAALERQGGVLPSSPGARYFEERRIRVGVSQEIDAWLSEAGARIAKALLDLAVEFREREVVSDGAPGEEGAGMLNWAFLVSRSRVDDFSARLQQINTEHADSGLVLSLSGPWPPYSFCPPLDSRPCGDAPVQMSS